MWQCLECTKNEKKRYNPFSAINFDKYDPVQITESEDIAELSNVLESCKSYNPEKFKNLLQENSNYEILPSILFNNIDGNQSNFDHFVCDISQYSHSFSFIGISETNIDPCHMDLYTIPGYTSEYNVKNSNKNKGSGVALYIKENYTYTRLEELCKCSKNLEYLFIQVTNTNEPFFVGVLYRPPSGSKVEALVELENLLQKLPSKIVFVTGDFNDDLFIPGSQKFESTIFSNNMIPLISLATHFKPGCNPSLLDNVLTNSLENIKVAGVFESGVSHHHPIFCFFEDVVPKIEIVTTTKPKYDYCESNLGGFELDMRELAITGNEYSESSFNIFVNAIKIKIDNNFRTESDSTKKSTRKAC